MSADLEMALLQEHTNLKRWFGVKPEDDAAEVQRAAYDLRLSMQAVSAILDGHERDHGGA